MLIYPRDETVSVLPPRQVIPVQRLSQAPSRLPAQYRAGQQLTVDNRSAPANNLHTKKLLIYPRDGSRKALVIIGELQASAS